MTEDSDPTPRIATFFARYPEPLALPSDGAHLIGFAGELHGYSSLSAMALHYKGAQPEIWFPPQGALAPFVSLRFHRGVRPDSVIAENMADLSRVVSEIAPTLVTDTPSSADELDDKWAAYTVVEMVTPLIRPGLDGTFVPAPGGPSFMGPNLTRSIEALIKLVTAYRLVENVPIPAPARERLGPFIIGSSRPADPAYGGWDDAGGSVVNTFATPGYHPMPDEPTAELIAKLDAFRLNHELEHPSVAIKELLADAQVALHQRGDFRAAVVLAYTASEVLLDSVLLALLWEEGVSPETAAAYFTKVLLTRVRSEYHPRIGGTWTTTAQSKVGTWRDSCVLLRHQVVHAGSLPDRDATELALKAFIGLRTHTFDRLVAARNKYPRATSLLVSPPGFQRRDAWTKKAQLAASQVTWEVIAEFSHYRETVLALRLAGS